MASPTTADRDAEEVVARFVAEQWDPALSVGEWWQRLADSGLAHPALPTNAGGLGWNPVQVQRGMRTLAELGVIGPPPGLGHMLAAPTIAQHGTQEQIDRYIPSILNGRHAWCQLFSEPQAGSDLAGLQTRAELDGEEWLINGQKVWTSQGMYADFGILIARSDPDQPKHAGISYFLLDMHQEGVEVRPLREMTGRNFFSEVFMDNARTHAANLLGERGEGWKIANTTLGFERSSIGAGFGGYVMVAPGQRANNFGRICGDVIDAARTPKAGGSAPGPGMKLFDRYRELADRLERTSDPLLRQELAKVYTLLSLNRLNLQRARDRRQRTGGEANIAKLFDAELHRRFRELSVGIIGADALLAGESSRTDPSIAELVLYASAPSIYGGSDQVQRNIIGERVLGLPKEPGPDRSTPYRDLPKNA